jgi:hypothetical protein
MVIGSITELASPKINGLSLSEQLLAQIRDLLTDIRSKTPVGAHLAYPKNTAAVQVLRVPVLVANRAYQCPELSIPDGMALVIKAAPYNNAAGYIRVGQTAAECLNINSSFPLVPNESISLYIVNANKLYFSGTVTGDFVYFLVETRSHREFIEEVI